MTEKERYNVWLKFCEIFELEIKRQKVPVSANEYYRREQWIAGTKINGKFQPITIMTHVIKGEWGNFNTDTKNLVEKHFYEFRLLKKFWFKTTDWYTKKEKLIFLNEAYEYKQIIPDFYKVLEITINTVYKDEPLKLKTMLSKVKKFLLEFDFE